MSDPVASPAGQIRAQGWRARTVPWLLMVSFVGLILWLDWPVCPSKTLFGIPCPGCGMTRALRALLAGKFAVAFALHPLSLPILVLIGGTAFRTIVFAKHGASNPRAARLGRWLWGSAVVLLVATWLLRLAFGLHPDGVDLESGVLGRFL